MSVISMKQLLEAGVHFGHQTRRWNPKMAPYIYTERNGIYIIDLQKSVGMVDAAYKAVFDIAAQGGTVLFVGTKKQAQDAIKTEAERCGMFYVNERWLGGMLTNFKTIQSRIARLKAIEKMSEDGTFDVLPKKEVIALKKEWEKLEKNLGGIKDMKRIPDAIFVVDPKKERICVQEAHTLGIPLIGIADTNCDPEELDYVIPGNDDAIRAVKLIVSTMADAVVEANQGAAEGCSRCSEDVSPDHVPDESRKPCKRLPQFEILPPRLVGSRIVLHCHFSPAPRRRSNKHDAFRGRARFEAAHRFLRVRQSPAGTGCQ